MDKATIIITAITFVSWGVGSFIAKLSTNRIGEQAVFWDIIGYLPPIVIYSIITFKLKNLFYQTDGIGIGLGIIAGIIGSFGLIGLYVLLNRAEASRMIPLTALYPVLTVILAIIFLHESITLPKTAGIIFSLVAIYLLSL